MSTAEKLLSPNLELIYKLESLPILSSVVDEVSKIYNNPMSSQSAVEKVIRADPSLTALILKTVALKDNKNSSLAQSITSLGLKNIHQLALSNCEVPKPLNDESLILKKLWIHSFGVAITAQIIGERIKHKAPSDLYTCGLLHDIGKTALLATTQRLGYSSNHLSLELEILTPQAYIEAGQILAKNWNLPAQIQNAICFHNEPMASKRGKLTDEMNQIVDIILLASALITSNPPGQTGKKKILDVPRALLYRLFISDSLLFNIQVEIKDTFAKFEKFLSVMVP